MSRVTMKGRALAWLMAAIMAVCFMPVLGTTAHAVTGPIKIVSNGTELDYTMPDNNVSEAVYTGVSKEPAGVIVTGASGVSLDILFDAAGISNYEGSSVEITVSDNTGYSKTFSASNLFSGKAYYSGTSPKFVYDKDAAGTDVVPIIADTETQLLYGQLDKESTTTNGWVKGVTQIEITGASEGFAKGDGTRANPYTITTEAQLKNLATKVNAGTNFADKYFSMDNDLELTEAWTPIGTEDNAFAGIFNGRGNTISGLSIEQDASFLGLFGNVTGTVRNLTVKGDVTCSGYGKDYIAGIVGKLSTGGTISRCTSYVNVTANTIDTGLYDKTSTTTYNVGGIAGFSGQLGSEASANNTLILDCVNYGKIIGVQHMGGIVGYNNGRVEGCSNHGMIENWYSRKGGTGGIAGFNGNNNFPALSAGSVTDCTNDGPIVSINNGSWFGGIVGFNNRLSTIEDCKSINEITNAWADFGPIVGNNEGKTHGCKLIQQDLISISGVQYTYDKTTKTGAAVVKNKFDRELTSDEDYTLSGSLSASYPGIYKITATGKDSFKGAVNGTWRINPKGTTNRTPTAYKGALRVKWYKQSAKMPKYRISGYQAQVAKNSTFTSGVKTSTIKGYKSTSKKFTKLSKKTNYYTRVRTYMKTSRGTVYSSWSAVKVKKTR